MLKASIMKPRTTFIELSQPPDFGIRFIIEGNKANIVNGNAKANPNPSIPIVGLTTSPLAASTSNAPTIGPVQEKDTITVVKPMKKEASIPPLSTLESAPEAHLFGSTISYAPKNDIENTTNKIKNKVLGIQ